MKPRERFVTALNTRIPDRVPIFVAGSPEDVKRETLECLEIGGPGEK